MDCLLNYIGVRAAGQPVPDSGLYINDLPGITMAQLSDLNNSDQATWSNLWTTIQTRSTKIFETDFTNVMAKRFRLKKITEAYKTAQSIAAGVTYAPVAGELRGLMVDSYLWKSPFHHIPVQIVYVYTIAAGSYTLNIWGVDVDTDALTVLDTFNFTGAANTWNKVVVNKKYFDNRRIFIGYDASEITSPSVPLNGYELNSFLTGDIASFFSHVFVNGITHNGTTITNQETTEAYGVSTTLGMQCDFDPLVCNYKRNIAVAFWYLLGAELMRERQYTDRVNRYTTVDLEKAKTLEKALRNDYMSELMTFVESVDLSKDWCIDCNQQITRREYLP